MSVADAFVVWEYSAKSSGGFQTVSALKEYGLLQATSAGKVRLTPEALAYFRDERESEHERLRGYFAHRPLLIQKLWIDSKWQANPPSDPIARSHLKNEVGLSEQSARSFLAIYKENIAFAWDKTDSKPPDPAPDKGKGGLKNDPPPPPPAINKVTVMEGERVAFTEEMRPGQYLKVIASGDVDEFLLDALDDFVKRQRKLRELLKRPMGQAKRPDDE
jgi:hypothetical protein